MTEQDEFHDEYRDQYRDDYQDHYQGGYLDENQASDNPSPEKKQGSGCAKYILFGCLTMIVLMVIGGLFAYWGIKGLVSSLVEDYTDSEPRELPQVVVSEEEAEAILARVDAFTKAVNAGEPTEPLILDGDDINELIHSHPAWSQLAGKVFVTIEDDRIQGEVSIPLDDVGKLVKGRYLNGSATFRIGLAAGHLFVFVESLEVNEKAVPDALMEQLRSENLAEDSNEDPDFQSVIDKIESITVKDGQLHIVPKSPE